MKQLFILFILFFAAGWMACSDSDQESGLQMTVDRSAILADGADEARFTVTLNGRDVTSNAVVKEQSSGETLVNGIFVTSVAGTYSFVAEYEGTRSETIKVTAEKRGGFKKNVLVMKFTAIGCYNCPDAEHAILKAEKDIPGRVYPISIYSTLGQMKDFMIEEYINSFKKYFGFNEYPTVVLDHANNWNYRYGIEEMAFAKALKAKGEIGIAITTKWDGEELKVDVKVKGGQQIDYTTNLVVAVLENNLYAIQTGAVTDEDNYHHHVVRKYLTDLYGEKIEKGVLKSTEEYTRSFSYMVPEEFKKANLEVMVYLLKASDKSALNCQTVLAGQKVDYETL